VIYEGQRFDEYVAPSELSICYLPVFYKYITPSGLKSLKLIRMGSLSQFPLWKRGIKGDLKTLKIEFVALIVNYAKNSH
jgi:hypothetical protein